MTHANTEILTQFEDLCAKRKEEILNAKDEIVITGTTYYVSTSGNDDNDGKTPETAWKTLEKVSNAELNEGDGVRFCRGDLFRGYFITKPGVTYAAYGEGEKPKFYGWIENLADPSVWELYDESHNIWKYRKSITDCGSLVFEGGKQHSRKLIPSYKNGKFVCRDDESRDFVMQDEMTKDLDIVCFYTERLTTQEFDGESFPVPFIDHESYGELYLRCDKGNPGEVFGDIEAIVAGTIVRIWSHANVTVDNLCLKYCCFAVSGGGHVAGLHVSNCEIGWIGGNIQHYYGTDPNYPQGTRGSVTRFGNGIEIYGGCEDYIIKNCYIYQSYDAGVTHQITTCGNTIKLEDIYYLDNVIEYCVYGIEYFLNKTEGDVTSKIKNCEMAGNIIRYSGYGWGQQRHNTNTPAHIKGWSYENTAENYSVHDNHFGPAAYRMLHLVAKEPESCPKMWNNTYIQNVGKTLGQYGANKETEPEILPFDENAQEYIDNIFCDKDAKVYGIK